MISAETNYKTAKADFDFQSNIALNKELQEAKAEVETSQVDLRNIQDEMRSLGVNVNINDDDHTKDTSLVAVRSPLSGMITERKFNAGAGIEAAQAIFAISNLSTVYVIANVPEASVGKPVVGSVAEVKSASFGTINASHTLVRVSTKQRERQKSVWKFRIKTANFAPECSRKSDLTREQTRRAARN